MFDSMSDRFAYAVVCDGMGGANGGKFASSTAVSTFSSILASTNVLQNDTDFKKVLSYAIDCANKEIYKMSVEDEALRGMGTTIVSAVIDGFDGYFMNIGDSRAYIVRNDEIRRITKDHSAVQELIDQGLLTESQARNHPNKNIITRALGVDETVSFDFYKEKLQPGDIIVLCTDGMTNYIDDLEIPFEILNNNLENTPHRLIELANSRGGSDNSTVVIIKM